MKLNQSTLRSVSLMLGLVSAFALTGCTNEELALEHEYVANSGAAQYPITVSKGPVTLNVAKKGSSLTPAQINAVSGFARKAGSDTHVTVSHPAGSSSRLSHEVANLISQQGVPAHNIRMTHYKGAASGPVKISYNQLRAKTEECGDWSRDVTETRFNELATNHGCAVQSNIAAMLADPNDVETASPVDPATASSRVSGIHSIDGTVIEGRGQDSSSSSPSGGSGGGGGAGGGGDAL
jgi:pilus assembly protein CpaD